MNGWRPRKLGRVSGRATRLLSLSILVVARGLAILTSDALALGRALNTGGIAFAISLETMGVLAIASLRMNDSLSFGYDLLLKSMGIVSLDALYGRMKIVVMKTIIFAV